MTNEERARVLVEVGSVCILGCKGNCVCCRVRRALGFESFEEVFAFYRKVPMPKDRKVPMPKVEPTEEEAHDERL